MKLKVLVQFVNNKVIVDTGKLDSYITEGENTDECIDKATTLAYLEHSDVEHEGYIISYVEIAE